MIAFIFTAFWRAADRAVPEEPLITSPLFCLEDSAFLLQGDSPTPCLLEVNHWLKPLSLFCTCSLYFWFVMIWKRLVWMWKLQKKRALKIEISFSTEKTRSRMGERYIMTYYLLIYIHTIWNIIWRICHSHLTRARTWMSCSRCHVMRPMCIHLKQMGD